MAAGVEFGDLNWIGLVVAIVFNIVLGFIWYNAKVPTGKIWFKGVGLDPNQKINPKKMAVAMVLMVVGAFFLMFVLAHNFIAYRDAYDIDTEGTGYDLTVADGLLGGVFTWLGFFVPVLWGASTWEGRPWSLFFVNAGYYLVTLTAAGLFLVLI